MIDNTTTSSDVENDVNFALTICKKVFSNSNIDGDVYINGVLSVVSALSDSYQEILRMRFRENKTYREIGEVFQLSAQRIRQIELKIFLKLKHPSRSQKMRVSYIIAEKDSLRASLQESNKALQKATSRCEALEQIIPQYMLEQLNAEIETMSISNIPISDLGLSIRLYNCLLKTGITNIEGITELKTYDDIISIKNLGKKCVHELFSVMNDKGYVEWVEIIKSTK